MTVRSPAAFEFTPTNVPPDLLDARTVGRSELLERIEERIRRAATGGGKTHTLVVGARGSGKTHVLTVAAHRAASAADLAPALSIISLTEDAEGVVSYADLLFTMIERALREDESALIDAGATLAAARASRRDPDALERLVRELAGERTVLLVIENLDRIFGDIGLDGQRRLRAFVENWRRIVILASTPLLFPAVSDHEQPWYGSFVPEHLDEVDVEQGTQLLIALARERGDDELAAFLAGDRARQRLRAVADIAGGSPRMWVMLSGCLTAELLDELLPLIERLLENLVPYYQARLGELPGNERKLVIELARTSVVDAGGTVVYRSQGARTVSDLAEACGLDRNVASTSLRRLVDARWVRTLHVAGTDGRTSWYELREPLFRHHLQHRETAGGTLAVVVGLLKAWHSFSDRVAMLGATPGGSAAEKHLLASLDAPAVSDAGYARGDPDELLGEARRWDGESTALGPLSRTVAEAAVRGARRRNGTESLSTEHVPASMRGLAFDAVAAASGAAEADASDDEARRVLAGLVAACARASEHDSDAHAELSLLAGGWAGARGDASEAVRCLSEAGRAGRDRLGLVIEGELAFFRSRSGDPRGQDLAVLCHARALDRLGAEDPDTLTLRWAVARIAGDRGEHDVARDGFVAVAEARGRVLGVEHPSTLRARHNAAYQAGELGEHGVAREEFLGLAEAFGRVLGEEHPDTLRSRVNAAYQAGTLGEHALARHELLEVAEAYGRAMGDEHPDALSSRQLAAYQAMQLGEREVARDEARAVAEARGRVLGVEHPDTLNSRRDAAFLAGMLGEHEASRRELLAVAEINARVAGPKQRDTVEGLSRAAYELALAGDEAAAIHELAEIRGTLDGDRDPISVVDFTLGDVLALIREPDGAAQALEALADLAPEATVMALALATVVRRDDASDRGEWLTVWSRAVGHRAGMDLLGRAFAAAGDLRAGRPAAAQAMPEEERRLAYEIAGLAESPS